MRLTIEAARAALLLTGTALCAATWGGGGQTPWGGGFASQDAVAQSLGAVQSGALAPLDAWQVGQTPVGEASLPATLWKNSDAAAVGPLMAKLTGPFASPAATRLARAALMSGGAPPAGSEIAAGDAAAKRFAALGRFGAADEIAAMARLAPAATADANIITYAAQADLARGRAADACKRAAEIASNPQFILRLRAFCFAVDGEQGATDLAMEVARTAGVNDFWLFSALPAIYGQGKGPAARFDSSLNASVSLAGKLNTGAKPLMNASLLALDVVARTPEAPALLRAEAGQSALRQYAISVAAARDALSSALGAKQTKTHPLPSLVAALQGVALAKDPPAKAAAIETALRRAATWSDYVAAARVLKPDIDALAPSVATASSAASLARACLAAGDVRAAGAWRDAIAQASKPPGEIYRAALDVALVAAGDGDDSAARAAIERRVDLGGVNAARAAAIVGALGLPIPARAAALAPTPPAPKSVRPVPPALLAALIDASQRGAQGETALLVAQALAPGAQTIDTASLVSAIQALRAVGLTGQAREAAIEALIAGGIG